jgi:large conductance mechanosensitive channel
MLQQGKALAGKGSAFVNDFKSFIARGNVVDLAVGIIIGAAFTTIVNSLVKDIIMPPIGMVTGGVDFSDLYINLSGGEYPTLAAATAAGAATINYGIFLNAIINFLIVAFAVFVLVKQVQRFRKQEEAKPVEPPQSELLLAEIRDLLKEQRK